MTRLTGIRSWCAKTLPTDTSRLSARWKDYGVVVREIDADLAEYDVDAETTDRERDTDSRRTCRAGSLEDPEAVAARYRAGEIDMLDVVRQHGVILNWGSGELLPKTTDGFRAMFKAADRTSLE